MWSAKSSHLPQRGQKKGEEWDKSGQSWAENVESAWDAQILSLDGGGIRGYSSFLILKALMHEIWLWEERLEKKEAQGGDTSRHQSGNDETESGNTDRISFVEEELLPCHYFDFMYGRSSGALIASLLGRLRMTVGESFSICRRLHNEWFSNGRTPPLEAAGSSDEFIQGVIGSRCREHDDCDGKDDLFLLATSDFLRGTRPFDVESPRLCQTCCLTATDDENCSEAHLIRTYPHYYSESTPNWTTRYNEGKDELKIWEVVRATSASLFHFQKLGADVQGQSNTLKDKGIR